MHLASMTSGLSRKTVVKIVDHFEAYGRIYHEDETLRGAGSPASTRWPVPPEGAREALKEYFEEQLLHKEPVWITRKVVCDWFDHIQRSGHQHHMERRKLP
jgi:hypothetical protein